MQVTVVQMILFRGAINYFQRRWQRKNVDPVCKDAILRGAVMGCAIVGRLSSAFDHWPLTLSL
jgi:hypothetical protein